MAKKYRLELDCDVMRTFEADSESEAVDKLLDEVRMYVFVYDPEEAEE